MAKTRRQMLENLKNIDLVCELVDARIPQVSRNPDMDDIAGDKPVSYTHLDVYKRQVQIYSITSKLRL